MSVRREGLVVQDSRDHLEHERHIVRRSRDSTLPDVGRDLGKRDEISLVYAGGIRNGADVAKAIALGADAIAIGHSAMMALNCNKDIPEANYQEEMGVDKTSPKPAKESCTLAWRAFDTWCKSGQKGVAL